MGYPARELRGIDYNKEPLKQEASLKKILTPLLLMLQIAAANQPSPSYDHAQKKEIYLGVLRHDCRSALKRSYERGPDAHLAYYHSSPSMLEKIFSPRPFLITNINTRGKTSAVAGGLAWEINFKCFVLQASFGGALHNGRLKRNANGTKGLGSRALFHESASLGIRIDHCVLSAYVDHMSNARLANPNPGITNVGFRLGHQF